MEKLSIQRRESLKNQTARYHQNLVDSPAQDYLAERGLLGVNDEKLKQLRLGYVPSEVNVYGGMLSIPYLRRHPRHGWGCVSMRYRNLNGDKPKYLTEPGDRPRIYNTVALTASSPVVGIAEGEMDAISATLAGLPTVGIPGVNSWEPYWSAMFLGYERVFIFTDGDEPGRNFGKRLAGQLPNASVVHLPDGEDVNSVLVNSGAEGVKSLWQTQ